MTHEDFSSRHQQTKPSSNRSFAPINEKPNLSHAVIPERVLVVPARAKEILVDAHSHYDGHLRRLDRAHPKLGNRTLHLHNLLDSNPPYENSWIVGILSRQCGGTH